MAVECRKKCYCQLVNPWTLELMLLNAASFTTGKAPKLWMFSLSKTCKPQSLKGAAVLFQSGHSLQMCLWLKGSNSSAKLQHNLPVKHMRDQKSSKCVLPVHPGVSSSNSSIISNKKNLLPDDPICLVVPKLIWFKSWRLLYFHLLERWWLCVAMEIRGPVRFSPWSCHCKSAVLIAKS